MTITMKKEKKAKPIVSNGIDPVQIMHVYADSQRGKKIYSGIPLDLSEETYLKNIVEAAEQIEKSKLSEKQMHDCMMDMLTIGTSGHSEELAKIATVHFQNMADIVGPESKERYDLYQSMAKAVQPFGPKDLALNAYKGKAKVEDSSTIEVRQTAKRLIQLARS